MSLAAGPHHHPRLGPADAAVVQRGLKAVGWPRPSSAVKLSGGGSGSQVFLLDAGGERVVLKVTEDPAWLDRATRELRVYDELGPTVGFLPRVRATQHDGHAVRLLLEAHDPHPPPGVLAHRTWLGVADQLGELHCTPVLPSTWLRPRPRPSPEAVASAIRLWADHGSGLLAARAAAQLAAIGDSDLAGAATEADLIEAEGGAESGLRPVLTHGDCHLGNLLQSPAGRTLWIDWQEVCLSTGLDDLVFLWQRAEFAGAHPPRDEMAAAYAAARSLPLSSVLWAAVDTCELRLLLLAWPPFLTYGTPQRQALMTQRLQQLVDGGDQ